MGVARLLRTVRDTPRCTGSRRPRRSTRGTSRARPELSIVVLDSQAPVGEGQGVYMAAGRRTARGRRGGPGRHRDLPASRSRTARRPGPSRTFAEPGGAAPLPGARVRALGPRPGAPAGSADPRPAVTSRKDLGMIGPAILPGMGRSPHRRSVRASRVGDAAADRRLSLNSRRSSSKQRSPGPTARSWKRCVTSSGGDTYYLAHLTGDPAREIDSDGSGSRRS